MKRREILKPEVAGRYKSFCRDSQSITTWLFGDELPKSIRDIAQAKRMSVKQFCDKRKFDCPSASTGKRFNSDSGSLNFKRRSDPYRPWRGRGRNYRAQSGIKRSNLQSSAENVNSTALVTPLVSYPPQVSGRLRLFAKNWAKITSDPWVLETVRWGYKIEFSHLPFQSHYKIQQNCFPFSECESISGELKSCSPRSH